MLEFYSRPKKKLFFLVVAAIAAVVVAAAVVFEKGLFLVIGVKVRKVPTKWTR